MIKLMFILLSLSLVKLAVAQNKKFADEMYQALHIHDTAKVITSEIASLYAFEKLMEKYPTEWLPGFWSSYLCTQIGRLDGKDPNFPKNLNFKLMMDKSTKYYELSKKNAVKITDQERSDLHALQGLIYSFLRKALNDRYDSLMQDEYKKAIKVNPLNLNLQIQFAISLAIRENVKYQDLVASLAVFDYTSQLLKKIENRALTTYYSQDFLGFWRGQTADKLNKMLSQP